MNNANNKSDLCVSGGLSNKNICQVKKCENNKVNSDTLFTDKSDEEKGLINDDHNKKYANTKNKKTLSDKIRYIKDNITVEPTLACSIIPTVLSRIAVMNLNLDKACRVNLKYGDVVCDALVKKTANYFHEEIEVQKLISSIEAWRSIIHTAIPSLLVIFLGAWSDRTGNRKFCILFPIFGEFITAFSNLLNTYFFYEIPVEVTMFLEYIFPALTGGWVTMYMGAFSYIGDVTTKETRTFRIGLVNLCMTAAWPVGMALSGLMLNVMGYYGVFSVSATLYALSLLYGYKYLENPKRILTKEIEKSNKTEGSPEKKINFIVRFFDVKHVKDTVRVVFKKGPDGRRLKFTLIFIAVALIHGPYSGEYVVKYLYTRYRFQWDAVQFSFYSTFSIVSHFFGALCSITVFSKMLKWDDSVLGLISISSKLVGALGMGLARNAFEMYAATAVETLNATAFTSLRSLASKLVNSEEEGKMVSLFNLVETMSSLVFSPIYAKLYTTTMHILPGSVFFLSSCLTLPSLCIFSWFFSDHRRRVAVQTTAEKHTKEENYDNEKLDLSHAACADTNC